MKKSFAFLRKNLRNLVKQDEEEVLQYCADVPPWKTHVKLKYEHSEYGFLVVKHPQNGTRSAVGRATLPPLLKAPDNTDYQGFCVLCRQSESSIEIKDFIKENVALVEYANGFYLVRSSSGIRGYIKGTAIREINSASGVDF